VDVSETGGANQIQPSALLHATHLGGRGGGGGGKAGGGGGGREGGFKLVVLPLKIVLLVGVPYPPHSTPSSVLPRAYIPKLVIRALALALSLITNLGIDPLGTNEITASGIEECLLGIILCTSTSGARNRQQRLFSLLLLCCCCCIH